MEAFQALAVEKQKESIAGRLKNMLEYAWDNNAFYREFYERAGFRPSDVCSFQDLQKIPIVTRELLASADLAKRSTPQFGRIVANTGGSSGEPLVFYLDRDAFAREWAHMHTIWARCGYRPTDCKLTFRGKNLGRKPIRYNCVHNEYMVNAYASRESQADAIRTVAARIRYLHGYPSSVYEFIRYCSGQRPDLLRIFQKHLRGILLGSEYPAPVYRDHIERVLGVKSISWYGHSEMALLAGETKPFYYVPFHSYGYCEAIPNDEGDYRLIGTSYDNVACPFIRYDTGDLISPEFREQLLVGFRVKQGRVGDFVTDASGNRISLTALIFGRHHAIFGDARFVQVRQERPGEMTLVVTLPEGHDLDDAQVLGGFDTTNCAMRFRVELRTSPFRTPSGKVPLMIPGNAQEQSSL